MAHGFVYRARHVWSVVFSLELLVQMRLSGVFCFRKNATIVMFRTRTFVAALFGQLRLFLSKSIPNAKNYLSGA